MIFKKIASFAGINTPAGTHPFFCALLRIGSLVSITRRIVVLAVLGAGSLCVSAQQKPNDNVSAWKVIDSLIDKKGLTQSARTEVDKLYARAKKDHNDPQVIKALLYRMNLQQIREEDAAVKNAAALEKEIDSTHEPARSILTSLLAETYWNYFQQNRYKLYDRSAIANNDKAPNNYEKEDISTWDRTRFHKRIGELYLASLKDERLLQQTDLSSFDAIIIKGNVRNLRPTLFDLLAHRALDYFKSSEQDLDRPAYAFEIEDTLAFSDRTVFAVHSFINDDSVSLHFKALGLFQRLIRQHLKDSNPSALLDVDIERIGFVNLYGTMEDKEGLYNRALQHITSAYPDEPVAAQAWYLQAQVLANKAARYDPNEDTANRYAYLPAEDICNRVLQQKDSSEGKSNCSSLLRTIRQKTLHLETEKVNLPGQPFRTLVAWRNSSQLFYRLIRLDAFTKESLGNNPYQDDYWKKLLAFTPVKESSQTLPVNGDHQQHRVEIRIDSLPVGKYALIASSGGEFSVNSPAMTVQFFDVSGIACINQGNHFFVLDRNSGYPLAQAKVQVWNRDSYDKNGQPKFTKSESYQTDTHGYFLLKGQLENRYTGVWLDISTGSDHLFTNENQHIRFTARNEDGQRRTTFFFTDRSIYRPGQTVFFKGIVITRDPMTGHSKIVTDFSTKLFLYNANNVAVDSVLLRTNEFGSYQGRFRLPENQLNGQFRLEDDSASGSSNFSVEEYKRPKFYITYDPLKGSYRVNDILKVTGRAQAYAGNAIDGATVSFRVVRRPRYPPSGPFWKRHVPPSNPQEIQHGILKTGVDGSFTISFPAIPDRTIDKSLEPVFDYRVTADITDAGGETRSGETDISVGYKVLTLSIQLPEGPVSGGPLPRDSLHAIGIGTNNLSGEFEPTPVHITIYKLKTPDRLIRARYWQKPDQFVMTREEYIHNFPHDEYRDETEQESWPMAEKELDFMDSSRSNKRVLLNNKELKSGWHLITVIAKDKFGQEVKNTEFVELYEGSDAKPSIPQYDWPLGSEETVEPGKKLAILVGSSAQDVFVIRQVERPGKSPDDRVSGNSQGTGESQYSFLTVSNGKNDFDLPIGEADRGGLGVRHAFVKDNRFYTGLFTIQVPWTNKDLSIVYKSYRDKTLPGSGERWQLTVRGNKGEKVSTEILSAMYDASLDQFKPQQWAKPHLWSQYWPFENWGGHNNFSEVRSILKSPRETNDNYFPKRYDALFRPGTMETGSVLYESRILVRGGVAPSPMSSLSRKLSDGNMPGDDPRYSMSGEMFAQGAKMSSDSVSYNLSSRPGQNPLAPTSQAPVQVRKNFNETAFFFPDLRTDSTGNISFSFTMPEALTSWKWMSLAHTKDLAFGYSEKTVITQKQLMVQPNAPRFLREGDRLELSTKIVNLSDSELTGQVTLELIDATTNESVDGWFINRQANQFFTVAAGQCAAVHFPIEIPYQFNRPVTYRIVARAKSFSDGEEDMLPVISNRVLVTESLPLNLRGSGTREFHFEKLLQSGSSETLNHHALTVEFSSNPAWYAVQALPYLAEYPYECAEQTFERYYANALAASIVKTTPRIREIFSTWKTTDTAALLSNLEKNPELKSVLLEETPWVLEARSESQQKKNIAVLFDATRMTRDLGAALNKLQGMQSPDGGFVWFKGGPDDRYITQTILSGIGHLKKLRAIPSDDAGELDAIVKAGLAYLDKKLIADYEQAKKESVKREASKTGNTGKRPGTPAARPITGDLSSLQIQYLYLRSLFNDYDIPGPVFPAMNFYRKQAQQYWLQQNRYLQGMIALALFRTGDIRTAQDIMKSLKQNALISEELGMYWKDMQGGYYWHQAPIETQSLLIEAFREITRDTAVDQGLKIWLLKQKQTQSWSTTKATADACYALLLGGGDWLTTDRRVEIRLGDKIVESAPVTGRQTTSDKMPAGAGSPAEAGTGYFKKVFPGNIVKPAMGNISVTLSPAPAGNAGGPGSGSVGESTGGIAWGAVYWQYFENADKVSASGEPIPGSSPSKDPNQPAIPLKLTKRLFVTRNTDRGPVLDPLEENAELRVGDKVTVRIELKADRDMEYVHMKDMRASCMEPVNVLSEYKWQDGLGYYETTKDASTNFFFDRVPRGVYVFEYSLFVSQAGNFSNGITTIQCMYAPEFGSHSEGTRVSVVGAP